MSTITKYNFSSKLTGIQNRWFNVNKPLNVSHIRDREIKPMLFALSVLENKLKKNCYIGSIIGSLFATHYFNKQSQETFTDECINVVCGAGIIWWIGKNLPKLVHIQKLIKVINEYDDHLLKNTIPHEETLQNWSSIFNKSRSFLKI